MWSIYVSKKGRKVLCMLDSHPDMQMAKIQKRGNALFGDRDIT